MDVSGMEEVDLPPVQLSHGSSDGRWSSWLGCIGDERQRGRDDGGLVNHGE